MTKTVVLTATGRDRVGIVAELTGLLFEMGLNLLDSSMTLLRGEFAIILMASLPANQPVDSLKARLIALEAKTALNIHVKELSSEELTVAPQTGNPHIISVYGADRTGIVAGITRTLAECSINITDVETKTTGNGKESIFVMILEVLVPEALSTDEVRSRLSEITHELSVDITIQPLEVYEL